MIPTAPKGTDDILPPESETWRVVLRAFDVLAERFGYEPVHTPLFEATELFARGVGEDTEVVEKQMYTFEDRGGRSVTLRPEATASVVRAYVQRGLTGVVKWSYAGPMFRYEQPQAGRRRQFHQVGVEYLGEPSSDADVEVIALGYRLLHDVGIDDAIVHVNTIGDPAERSDYRATLMRFLDDRRDDLSDEAQRRLDTNPLRVLDSKADAAVVADAPVPIDHVGEEARAHFDGVLAGLDREGIPYDITPLLVRGLDYYNRTVFEYESPSYRAAQSALGGGGRYDPLSGMIGGPDIAGVGLAMGVDRVVLAVPDVVDASALDAFLVVAETDLRDEALAFVSRLRAEGLRADLDLGSRSVKAQFRAADRRRAGSAVVVGAEWREGTVTVKHLASGEESVMAIEEAVAWLKTR